MTNAQYWVDLLKQKQWWRSDEPIVFDGCLLDGQPRLASFAGVRRRPSPEAVRLRRRRMVRVSTVKYRARRRRGR